jgi:hypothetical protein
MKLGQTGSRPRYRSTQKPDRKGGRLVEICASLTVGLLLSDKLQQPLIKCRHSLKQS